MSTAKLPFSGGPATLQSRYANSERGGMTGSEEARSKRFEPVPRLSGSNDTESASCLGFGTKGQLVPLPARTLTKPLRIGVFWALIDERMLSDTIIIGCAVHSHLRGQNPAGLTSSSTRTYHSTHYLELSVERGRYYCSVSRDDIP